MWEFKRSDDADMGQVIGKPQILKLKTSGSSSTSTYRWFAVVASGANNYVPDVNGVFSATGQPALFCWHWTSSLGPLGPWEPTISRSLCPLIVR